MTIDAYFDAWLKFDEDLIERFDLDPDCATHEANTRQTETGYAVDWCLTSVGQDSSLDFNNLDEGHSWLSENGFIQFA